LVIIKEAYPGDIDRILPVLSEEFHLNSLPSKRREAQLISFRRLFENHWHSDKKHIGFYLESKGRVVGFLAYIFSQRIILGKNYRFCNFSAWGVNRKYRSHSLVLINPINDLKKEGYILTNFSPSPAAYKVFSKLYDFKTLDNKQIVVPYLPLNFAGKSIHINYNEDIKTAELNERELADFEDIKNYKALKIQIKHSTGTCLAVFSRHIEKKKIALADTLYISNPGVFIKAVPKIRHTVNSKLKTAAVLIDSRLIRNEGKILFSFKRNNEYGRLFWSESLPEEFVDNLYSEFLF